MDEKVRANSIIKVDGLGEMVGVSDGKDEALMNKTLRFSAGGEEKDAFANNVGGFEGNKGISANDTQKFIEGSSEKGNETFVNSYPPPPQNSRKVTVNSGEGFKEKQFRASGNKEGNLNKKEGIRTPHPYAPPTEGNFGKGKSNGKDGFFGTIWAKILIAVVLIGLVGGVAGYFLLQKPNPTTLGIPNSLEINNKILTWGEVENAESYVIDIDGTEKTSENASYSLGELTERRIYEIKVKAIGDGRVYLDSEWSEAVKYTVSGGLDAPKGLQIEGNLLTWEAVDNAESYIIEIEGEEKPSETASYSIIELTEAGVYEIKVKAIGDGEVYFDSDWAKTEYTVPTEGLQFKEVDGGYAVWVPSSLQEENIIIPSVHESEPVVGIYRNEEDYYGYNEVIKSVSIPNSVKYIGDYAFGNFDVLESIEIPNSVKTIGDYSFVYCVSLTAVTFEEESKPTSIGEGAFEYCFNLESIEIPNSVETIGSFAFYYCESLAETAFGENSELKTIGDYAFAACYALENIEIPNSVTAIGEGAFSDCDGLKSIDIPKGVENIGYGAFYGCYGLESITAAEDNQNYSSADNCLLTKDGTTLILGCKNSVIPNGVETIEDYAFFGCVGLESVEFGEESKIQTIGEYAFYGCTGLESIEIPNGVTFIGDGAFDGCRNLKTVTFEEGSQLTAINGYTFNGCRNLESIEIPNGVISIGNYAFSDCRNLESVIIPNGVETIGDCAFVSCYKLKTVTFEEESKLTSIGGGAFGGCGGLESIEIPDGVTTIGNDAFAATGLKKVVIPNGVTSIGRSAFNNCDSLESVIIPISVTNIGELAFWNKGASLKLYCEAAGKPSGWEFRWNEGGGTVYWAGQWYVDTDGEVELGTKGLYFTLINDNTEYQVEVGSAAVENIVIPSVYKGLPVTKIEYGGFNNSNIKSVFIPNSVETIGTYAFKSCGSLESVNISNGVISIGESAFYNCRKLTGISIPSSVTTIGNHVFESCSALASITVAGDNLYYSSAGNCLLTKDGETLVAGCKNSVIPNSVKTIGEYAFAVRVGLESIFIPKSVETIGTYAFQECEMTSVIFETDSQLTFIDYSAFAYCSLLESIAIPSSVEFIGQKAFYYCNNLTVYVESANDSGWSSGWNNEGAKKVLFELDVMWHYEDGVPVEGTKGLAFELINDDTEYSVSKGSATGERIFIPSTYKGKPVTAIANRGFNNNSPEPNMRSVVIPNSVKTIGYDAFLQCFALESINIPNSVIYIGNNAFNNCLKLTSLSIPESVETIEESAFWGCSGLTSITVAGNNQNYSSAGDCLLTKDGETLIIGCKNSVIPSGVKTIKMVAFGNYEGLTSIFIPKNVETIERAAFGNCENLTTITFEAGSKLKTIGDHAFDRAGFTNVVLPNGVEFIGTGAFYYCQDLTSISIPESVEYIGNGAFDHCANLTVYVEGKKYIVDEFWDYNWNNNGAPRVLFELDVYWHYEDGLPVEGTKGLLFELNLTNDTYYVSGYEGTGENVFIPSTYKTKAVTQIGEEGFKNKMNIKSVVIPNSVSVIGNYAFSGCNKLESVNIPNGVISIGNYAFSSCSALESIDIPNSVISIGNYAFQSCAKLTAVEFEADSQLTSIGYGAFGNCLRLEGIIIPKSVETIGDSAFNICDKLATVEFEENSKLTAIGNNAFNGCIALESIVIPNSVETIGNSAFSGCTNLAAVTFEEDSQLTSIGNNAFYSCSALESITIPNGVLTIGNLAFSNCTGLTSIVIPNSVETIGNFAFNNCNDLTIYVENENDSGWYSGWNNNGAKKVVFELDVYWHYDENGNPVDGTKGLQFSLINGDTEYSVFEYAGAGKNIFIPSTYKGLPVTAIGEYGFDDSDLIYNIKSVFIPNSVRVIGNYAFRYCTALESINIPNSVEIIGYQAFYSCNKLTTVTFEEDGKLTSIGEGAFYNCIALESINIPNSVETINRYAFRFCQGLATVTFEEDSELTSIGEGAFSNCIALESIVIPSSVTSVGDAAFSGCENLTAVVFEENSQLSSIGWDAFHYCIALESIVIPLSVTVVGNAAFSYCNNLTVYVERKESEISGWDQNWNWNGAKKVLFELDVYWHYENGNPVEGTKGLVFTESGEGYSVSGAGVTGEKVFIPSAYKGVPVTEIGYEAFYYTNIKSVFIPNSVETIGNSAFYGCSALESIEIPNSVETIGVSAFEYSQGLTTVTFEEDSKLTSIGYSAFAYCFALESIEIPNGVTTIESTTFDHCTALENVVIPQSVDYIFNYAFRNCTNLGSITLLREGSFTVLYEQTFNGCGGLIIRVPAASVSVYSAEHPFFDSMFDGFYP